MKRYLFLVIAVLSALAVSCKQGEIIDQPDDPGSDDPGPVIPRPGDPDYGTPVDATFSISLGPEAKAFADGTTVDRLYVGIYEAGADNQFTWAADNSTAPVAISSRSASVTFNGIIQRGKYYRVIFWAQKEGVPYTIDWATHDSTGPIVWMTATGVANDESRDAFYGYYDTGGVTGSIDLTGSPVELRRPFAQINVLVPNSNIDDLTAPATSNMTIAGAPAKLNLATKQTDVPLDWSFAAAEITEPAFGEYAGTHKYVAMNYVLVDQSAFDPRYDVTYSVNNGAQLAFDKTVAKMPLRSNRRSNIVGNIFDENFNITIPTAINPEMEDDLILTSVILSEGQTRANALKLTLGSTYSLKIDVNHPIRYGDQKPEITVNPASVAKAEWNLSTGKLDITPLVKNGSAVITLVFPAIMYSPMYTAATVDVYIKVGNG